MTWQTDHDYRSIRLEKVTRSGNGYTLTDADGWTLFINDPGWAPQAGDVARFYGKGIGFAVRGVVVLPKHGGMPLVAYYRTAEEEEARAQKAIDDRRAENRTKLDAERDDRDRRWAALPPEFRQRFARFTTAKGDEWRAEYEPYELFCCEQAHEIITALEASGKGTADDVRAFGKLEWQQQRRVVPALSGDHSGNTFGTACRLAYWWFEKRENVAREHGALVPLTGCDAYGCTHTSTPLAP